jgi:hypothetical protein
VSGVGAEPAAGPPWFREVVGDSLLGGLCPLLPVPLVDDLVLLRMRRRMVDHLARRWGLALSRPQVARLAGGRGMGCGRFALRALVYPWRKLLEKVFYFLAVKEAVDTFSLLFHHGYLLHVAAARGGFGEAVGTSPGGAPALADETVERVAVAVEATLAVTNTGPLRRLLVGVLRNSRRLLAGALSWLRARLRRGGELPELGAAAAPPPAATDLDLLLDRLLLVLWGDAAYRARLEAELERHLRAQAPPAA